MFRNAVINSDQTAPVLQFMNYCQASNLTSVTEAYRYCVIPDTGVAGKELQSTLVNLKSKGLS